MDELSKEFWKERNELSTKGRWVRIKDDQAVTIEIDDWTITRPDSKYGKQQCLKTVSGKYLNVSARYITDLFREHDMVGRHVKFTMIRHDSVENSGDTWAEFIEVSFMDELLQDLDIKA